MDTLQNSVKNIGEIKRVFFECFRITTTRFLENFSTQLSAPVFIWCEECVKTARVSGMDRKYIHIHREGEVERERRKKYKTNGE